MHETCTFCSFAFINSFLLYTAKQGSIVWKDNVFVHLPADGHLKCLQFGVIMKEEKSFYTHCEQALCEHVFISPQ
ncbi:Uncharacterised protein [Chlamydia trachomatis]|nr:Uncharacterised protein [Chlamydia trachomatis]